MDESEIIKCNTVWRWSQSNKLNENQYDRTLDETRRIEQAIETSR